MLSLTNENPYNLATAEFYKGVTNIQALNKAKKEKNYIYNYWVTFKQAKELNFYVKKDEKATKILLPLFQTKKENEKEKEQNPYKFKVIYVFNYSQLTKKEEKKTRKKENKNVQLQLGL